MFKRLTVALVSLVGLSTGLNVEYGQEDVTNWSDFLGQEVTSLDQLNTLLRRTDDYDWLVVDFYSKDCGRCRAFKDEWNSAISYV